MLIAAPLAVFAVAYVPQVGRGFLKDDFAWIGGALMDGPSGLVELFSRNNGFYRPLVSLTFTIDHALFGLEPFFYGLTNVLLVMVCILAIVPLCRRLGMPRALAVATSAVWSLNFHGVGGAVMWISGRTALVLTAFAVLGGWAVLRDSLWLASALTLAAMLSKEEAVLLPAILAVWSGYRDGRSWDWRAAVRAAPILAFPLLPYALLRLRTSAFLPWRAPDYYTFTFEPLSVARNVAAYLDRSATLAAVFVILAAVVLRRVPRLEADEKRWAWLGLAWFIGGFGITLFLPVRSSLYVCFPSVGSSIVGAALIGSAWRRASPLARGQAALAACVLPLVLVPIYWSRNTRLAREAALSSRVIEELRNARSELREGKVLVLEDRTDTRYNLATIFGTLVQDAVRLSSGVDTARVWVEPPLPASEAAGLRAPGSGEAIVRYRLQDAHLVRVD